MNSNSNTKDIKLLNAKFMFKFYPSLDHRDACFISSTYDSFADCKQACDEIAEYTLLLQEVGILEDYSNFYECQVCKDVSKWETLDEDDFNLYD